MSGIGIMPAIPSVSAPFGSPPRPPPKFFIEAKTFSTKKERGNTPRSNSYPRPPIKSCPPISRVFQYVPHVDRPRMVSFKDPPDESLSPLYTREKRESYFHQCFQIEKKLGSGSFGDVYQVRCRDDGKQYAVKRSRERFKGDLDRRRKLEEVSKHELLPEHPHCVHFYKAWEERQHLYIQTELCESSLAYLGDSEHEIPERLIWNYLIDLLTAVKHLHDHELIHMDIKPDNIFITKDGTCQLGDFGLILDLSKHNSDISEAQEGDPKYLAPELMQGKYTKAADIFSLGITILELASDLDLPRGDEGWHQLRRGNLPENIVKDKISTDLWEVISLMMEPDYELRPTADMLLNLPCVKRAKRYNSFINTLRHQSEMVTGKVMVAWCYVIYVVTFLKHIFLSDDELSPADMETVNSPNSSTESNVSSEGVLLNNSWDHSLADDAVFDDGPPVSVYGDSVHEYEMSHRVEPKALTTGAKRRATRSARIMGNDESPAKRTPSQGSPMLPLSSRSRSSRGATVARAEPSSTTPPSCRKKVIFDDLKKKILFDDDDSKPVPIGPKNLMMAFDTADSDEEE